MRSGSTRQDRQPAGSDPLQPPRLTTATGTASPRLSSDPPRPPELAPDTGIDGVPIVRAAFPRTVRLVTTARLRAAVLADLAPPQDLDALAELEGATSARLIAQARGLPALTRDELVHGVPHAAFINASFAYARPRELNRFNGPGRGAWYAGLDTATCLAELEHHLTRALAATGVFEATVELAELHASFAGEFLDLRAAPAHVALHPDPETGYPAGNALAAAARARGLIGIVYPSVRHPGGTCLAALSPHAVQSVAQGDVYRMVWQGSPKPARALLDASASARLPEAHLR